VGSIVRFRSQSGSRPLSAEGQLSAKSGHFGSSPTAVRSSPGKLTVNSANYDAQRLNVDPAPVLLDNNVVGYRKIEPRTFPAVLVVKKGFERLLSRAIRVPLSRIRIFVTSGAQ
jgi:hypothetical protein